MKTSIRVQPVRDKIIVNFSSQWSTSSLFYVYVYINFFLFFQIVDEIFSVIVSVVVCCLLPFAFYTFLKSILSKINFDFNVNFEKWVKINEIMIFRSSDVFINLKILILFIRNNLLVKSKVRLQFIFTIQLKWTFIV